MSALVSGMIGGFVAATLVAVALRRQRPARKSADGWKTLRPGWLVNATIVGGACSAAFTGYILLFVGSSRPDAETQMTYALMLFIGFALATAYLAWISYGRTIMWKGDELRVRTSFGHDFVRRISDVRSVTRSDMLGEYRLRFRDGSTLRLSEYFHGAKELVARLPERVQTG